MIYREVLFRDLSLALLNDRSRLHTLGQCSKWTLTVGLWGYLIYSFLSCKRSSCQWINFWKLFLKTAEMFFVTSSSTPFLIFPLKKKQKVPFPTGTSDACVGIQMSLKFGSLAKSFLQLFCCCIEMKSLKSVLDRLINCFKENLLCLRRWMS